MPLTALLALLLVVLATGCVQIEGGAVELSWSIRDFNGTKVECNEVLIEDMRICWQATDAAGELECRLSHTFPCLASRGVSEFEVDEGETAFFVQLRCVVDGQELVPEGDFQVPAPIVRKVEKGKVVTLNQLLVLVTPRATCRSDKERAETDVSCTCAAKRGP